MNVFNELVKYQKYRVSVAVYDDMMVLTAEFPEKWVVNNEYDNILCKEDSKVKNKYYFISSMSSDDHYRELFKAFQSVVQENTEYEEKITLFKDYVERLNQLFEEKSLSELKTMEFKFKPSRKNKKKQVEEKEGNDDVV